jgi:hypothetical protein
MADGITLGVLAASIMMATPRPPAPPPAPSIEVVDFLPLTARAAASIVFRGNHTRVLYEWTTLQPDFEIVRAMLWPSIVPSIIVKGTDR